MIILIFIFFSYLYPLTILDRNGIEIKSYYTEDDCYFEKVKIEEISPWLILSTIAAEDSRFFTHNGFDFKATLRALWQNAKNGKKVSGGSTITQQLIKNIRKKERNIFNKVSEIINSLILEKKMTKYDILEEYFNTVYYGRIIKGVGAASKKYFGINVSDLSLAQSALISAIPKSPIKYDPIKNKEKAFKRQKYILKRMLELGYINSEVYDIAVKEEIIFSNNRTYPSTLHFANRIKEMYGDYTIVETSIDAQLNEEIQNILKSHLEIIKNNNVTNGSVVVINNITGQILAWVGSKDFFDEKNAGQVDGVISLRQPGSAIKPFIYMLAFKKGWKPSDIVNDAPFVIDDRYNPKNYDETYHGPVSLRRALACSYNVPAVYLADKVGIGEIIPFLNAVGLKSLTKKPDFYGSGIALGNGEVSLLELANAYATIARGGIYSDVSFLIKNNFNKQQRVIQSEYAYMITDILSDNTSRAWAFGLNSYLNLPFPFAAKTGTSKDYRDNWACGYTYAWTLCVWVGNFDGSPMRKVSGVTGSAPVMREVAILLNKRYPSHPFKKPIGILELDICPLSGKIRTSRCPSSVREVFIKSNTPLGFCDINHDNKKLEEQNFLNYIEFPKNGDVFKIDPHIPISAQAIKLRAKSENKNIVWNLNGEKFYGGDELWLDMKEGNYSVYFEFRKGKDLIKSNTIYFSIIK